MATWKTLLRRARTDLGDPQGNRWLDKDLIDYFVEAQEMACRDGYLLRSTKTVTISAGTSEYSYPTGAIQILRMSWGGTETPMQWRSINDMDRVAPGWDQGTKQGTPHIWVTGKTTKKFSIYLTPTSTEIADSATLMLTCVMLPSTTPGIDEFRDSTTPEIQAEHHYELVDYVKYRAHRQDMELDGDKKAADDLAIFTANMKKAKQEALRQHGAVNHSYPGTRAYPRIPRH